MYIETGIQSNFNPTRMWINIYKYIYSQSLRTVITVCVVEILMKMVNLNTKYWSMTVPLRWFDFRTFQGGQMKMLDAFPQERLKPLLPLKVERPDESCIRHRAMPTFLSCFAFPSQGYVTVFLQLSLYAHAWSGAIPIDMYKYLDG